MEVWGFSRIHNVRTNFTFNLASRVTCCFRSRFVIFGCSGQVGNVFFFFFSCFVYLRVYILYYLNWISVQFQGVFRSGVLFKVTNQLSSSSSPLIYVKIKKKNSFRIVKIIEDYSFQFLPNRKRGLFFIFLFN